MKPLFRKIVYLLLILGMGGAFYYGYNYIQQKAPTISEVQKQIPSKPSRTIQYPVPSESGQSGFASPTVNGAPPVDKSDPTIENALSTLLGKELFASLFHLNNIVRRIVVTVDNATQHAQPSWEMSPLKPLESSFIATRRNNDRIIAPANFQRYTPYANLARTVDPKKLVEVYVHFYSLFQAAYQDLGTEKYFNDRLVEVIDNVLKAPEIRDSIKVERLTPHNRYKYVDNSLESLPSGQKALVRMGYDNIRTIKEKLRQIRVLLTHLEGTTR